MAAGWGLCWTRVLLLLRGHMVKSATRRRTVACEPLLDTGTVILSCYCGPSETQSCTSQLSFSLEEGEAFKEGVLLPQSSPKGLRCGTGLSSFSLARWKDGTASRFMGQMGNLGALMQESFPGSSDAKAAACYGCRETWVRLPGREDPLEKEMATHSSILAWKISWMEEPGRMVQSMGSQRVGHD